MRSGKSLFAIILVHARGVLSVFAALAGVRVSAQATSGVTGVVTDNTGGVIAGVVVKLTNRETAFEATSTTTDTGTYRFLRVPPGTYTLTFSKDGFRSLSVGSVSLGVSVTETRDVRLDIGAVSDTVEVKAEGEATLNTVDSSVGNVIDPQRVQDLPSLFRTNAANLLTLEPGVQSEGGDAENGSVTGARADTGNLTLDGLDVNDESIGQAFATSVGVPIDSVLEVRTIVGGPDASFGRGSGAQVDLVTKSGTKDFHGSLHEYNRIRFFAANDWFNDFNGVRKPQLIRNQFGGDLGGPILKDKLFFFFNYEARRDTLIAQHLRTVPLDSFRNGEIAYINSNTGCTGNSTIQSQPQCISTLTPAQVKALDPSGIGADQALLSYILGRYPHPNTLSGGDGVNTGGYQFNSPSELRNATYVGRVDFLLNSRQKLFARATWDRNFDFLTTQEFPQDPNPQASRINHSRSFVVGYSWAVTSSISNQVSGGLTRELVDFPVNFAPTAPNQLAFRGLSGPNEDIRFQGRNTPVPQIRDEFSWTKGDHTIQFGTDIKPIRNYNLNGNTVVNPLIGIGGNIQQLDASTRPSDILQDPSAQSLFDNLFPTLLGHYAQVGAVYNYDRAGNALPIYSATHRNFHYNEFELYGQDIWRVRSNLNVTAGLRWQFHGVPFEANGFQSVSNINGSQLFADRVQAAANGVNGNAAAPLVTYSLGGPANHAPGYYQQQYRDFAPRLGLAYTPSFKDGFLGNLFGNRKTSIRAGAGISYDRVLNTLQFEIDQTTFLFDQSFNNSLGVPNNPFATLSGDARFTSITAIPDVPPPGTAPRPTNTPFVTPTGIPIGLQTNQCCFFQIDHNLKSPYSITMSFGIQRELPGNFLLDVNYFGRLGRRLIAVGDPAQQLNFKDAKSGQFLNDAYGKVQAQLQQGVAPSAVTSQPWFESQMNQAVQHFFGTDCAGLAAANSIAATNCTQLAAQVDAFHFEVGDLSSEILNLTQGGLLLRNTGLLAHTGGDGYVGNFASSNYHSLLLSLRKRMSHNLVFDFDYAYAHSIDNVSEIQNNSNQFSFSGQGLICDLRNLRLCRSNSDFDARHTISANYDYAFPVGTGQRLLHDAPKWLNAVVGGWSTSGIVSYHSGFPFTIHTNTFPINFTQDAPAVFVGPASAVRQNIHVDKGQLQFFADQTAALNAFAFPFGGGTGDRNNLRGPHFSNVDMALLKEFKMPWSESHRLQFRAEAFNVFNHPSFFVPNVVGATDPAYNILLAPTTFGTITQTASTARQMQFALRYDF